MQGDFTGGGFLDDSMGLDTVLILMWMAGTCPDGNAIEERIRRADALLNSGVYREALAEYSQVVECLKTGNPTGLFVAALNNLAGIHADLQNYGEAERLYLQALRFRDQLNVSEKPSRPVIQLNLLVVCIQAGWLRKAQRLVDATTHELATVDPQLRLRFLDLLGNLRRAQKRREESAEYYRQALELAETIGQEGAAGFLWNSIGVVRFDQGKIAEAVNAFERAVTAHERARGSEHPDLIAALTNIGAAYLVEGHLKRAQAVLVRARSLAERSFGVSHALYLILMFEARVLDRLNQKAEAKQLRRRAQTMSRNKSPRDPTPFVIDIEDLRRR
jgi:tetratricopeptide (TPR) repeat protein